MTSSVYSFVRKIKYRCTHAEEEKYQARPQKDTQTRPETLWWKLDPLRPGERVCLFLPLPTLPHLGINEEAEGRGQGELWVR